MMARLILPERKAIQCDAVVFGCTGKEKYITREQAQAAVVNAMKTARKRHPDFTPKANTRWRNWRKSTHRLRAYYCHHCEHFHWGHQLS